MNVTVKLFAGARELAGREEITVEVSQSPTVKELRSALPTACPGLAPLLQHALFAIDASYATDETPLSESTEIACIPPVSGG